MHSESVRGFVRRLSSKPLVVGLLLSVGVAVPMIDDFFSAATLGLVLNRGSVLGLLAVGLTVALIAGQLDLSAGSVMALSGIAAVGLQSSLGPVLAAVVAVLVGLLVGIMNAGLVVAFKVHSLIVTLGSMLAVRSVAHLLTDSQPVSGDYPLFGLNLVRPIAGPMSVRSLIFVGGIIALGVFLTKTVHGRNLLAVGSSAQAALASGVAANRYIFGSLAFSGFCAGVGGVVLSLGLNTGSPVFGQTIIVSVIAAVVVGGTRIEGGRGSAVGTLGGVLVLTLLEVVMEFNSVPSYTQQVVLGVILVLLVVGDSLLTRAEAERARRAAIGTHVDKGMATAGSNV